MNIIKKGTTDVTRYVNLVDSAAGTPETGYTITNLDLQYTRNRTAPAAKVDATALAATDSAHSDNKAIEIDATSSPGLYRIDWPDAAFATGADKVILVVSGTGLHPAVEEIQLVNYDPEDGVRLGLTALPNAAADAAGGLPISDADGLDLDAKIGALTYGTANRVNVQVYGMENDTVTAAAVANGAIDAATFAADVDAEFLSYIVDDATRIDASALNTATGTSIPAILTDTDQLQTLTVIRQNTAQAGSADSITLDASASAVAEFYKHALIRIVSGTGAGQAWRVINAYNESTKVASVTPNWSVSPDNTSVFVIAGTAESHVRQVEQDALTASGFAADSVAEIADAVWDEATSGHSSAGTFGKATSDILVDTAEIGVAGAGLTEAGGTGDHLTAISVASLATQAKADVNAEVVDALNVDTYAEPGQGTPAATLSLAAKINYMFKNWRNRKTQTSTQWSLYNDDATTVDQKATVSDDGTTAGKTEITSGP